MRKKVGLALGAGAMRGLAHIGVLQVFEEYDIPIDVVTGSSMGALIGALYCCGITPQMMEKLCLSLDETSFIDPKMPKRGFLRGDKAQAIIRTLTQNKQFSQVTTPLGVVACDLTHSTPVYFTQGSIHQAVRASIAIPGIFEPVLWGDALLVDGSVQIKVPTEFARNMGADVVIGVDVGYNGTYREIPKNILGIIMQSMELMEWETSKHRTISADMLLTPDTNGINPFALTDAEKCIEQGRICAKAAMPQILQMLGSIPDDDGIG